DRTVTGVQTCALPISQLAPAQEYRDLLRRVREERMARPLWPRQVQVRMGRRAPARRGDLPLHPSGDSGQGPRARAGALSAGARRSEERRVGEDWRSWG